MKDSTTLTTVNLGPGAIATPSVPGAPAFALSRTEWLAIQTYVTDAMTLPITLDSLKTTFGDGAPKSMDDFKKLIDAYVLINKHVGTWQNDTFPTSVSLASDIHNYSIQAPVYYNALIPIAQGLIKDPNDPTLKAELLAIIKVLKKSAKTYHDNAASVTKNVKKFADDTQKDKLSLCGVDGKSGLKKYYHDKYKLSESEVKDMTEQIKELRKEVKKYNDKYNHDVVVAATSAAYAWIFPLGTIAAAIVAGIYGKKAADAKRKADAFKKQIGKLKGKEKLEGNLLHYIDLAEDSMDDILDPLKEALPVIQKIQGVWSAITDDLDKIENMITYNIQEVPAFIMNLGIAAVLKEWDSVGKEADNYRVNAYVTVQK